MPHNETVLDDELALRLTFSLLKEMFPELLHFSPISVKENWDAEYVSLTLRLLIEFLGARAAIIEVRLSSLPVIHVLFEDFGLRRVHLAERCKGLSAVLVRMVATRGLLCRTDEGAQVEHVKAEDTRHWTKEQADAARIRAVCRLHLLLELSQIQVLALASLRLLAELLEEIEVLLALVLCLEHGQVLVSLHDDFVDLEKEVCLITHEHADDILII